MSYKCPFKYALLSLLSTLLVTTNSVAQDEQKNKLKIEYGIPLFLTVSEENSNSQSINTPSNTNVMFGGGLFVGNYNGFFVSADMSANFKVFDMSAPIKEYKFSGAVNYNINPNNPRYSITPFLGTSFGYWYGNYEVNQRWLIHCGIMIDYVFLKAKTRESVFLKVGYDFPTYASEWNGFPQSAPNPPNINMGGPFATIGITVWNKKT